MTARPVIARLLAALVLAALALAWPATRLSAALARERAAEAGLAAALQAERELMELRVSVASVLLATPPDGDVAAAVQGALREAGLSVQLLAEVTPQESVLAGNAADAAAPKWRRQSVRIRLNPVPLPELGSFLDRWRAAHQEWSISQIELRAVEARAQGDAATGTAMFAPRLTLLRPTWIGLNHDDQSRSHAPAACLLRVPGRLSVAAQRALRTAD
jgi:hypothetical protein